MVKKQILLLFACFLLLAACNGRNNVMGLKPPADQPIELTKLSAKGVTDQQPADQAKNILSEYDEVEAVRAVNDGDMLVIGVKLHHNDRFRMDDIERNLRKKVKKNFSDMDITLSTDEKIHIELTKLEDELVNKKISKDDVKKRIKKIKKLSEEKT